MKQLLETTVAYCVFAGWFILVAMLLVTFVSGLLTLIGVYAEGTAPCPFCIFVP